MTERVRLRVGVWRARRILKEIVVESSASDRSVLTLRRCGCGGGGEAAAPIRLQATYQPVAGGPGDESEVAHPGRPLRLAAQSRLCAGRSRGEPLAAGDQYGAGRLPVSWVKTWAAAAELSSTTSLRRRRQTPVQRGLRGRGNPRRRGTRALPSPTPSALLPG